MKKNQTVQGTFSKFFGKKHANPNTTSLYATNPPWIFTQEEGTRDLDGIYYGDNRFDTVSESGTATLKARPRVRPLLTFLPLNAQENHGLAVPTPSVPEDFADKEVTGTSSLVNGNLRLYSSVPPPTPVRTSSIPVQEAEGAPPEEEGATKKAPSRLPLPPNFHIRPASQAYPDRAPEPDRPGELRTVAPAGPMLGQFIKNPKSSSPAPKPKPNPPSPEDTASSEPVDWRDPGQMAKLRSELAAYLFGSKREDRCTSHRPGPTVACQGKEGKKGPSLPEKEMGSSSDPEKSPCPEREAAVNLTLPPVDYVSQDFPTPSVQQIRNELEARLSSLAEKEAKPSLKSLPPKPRLEGGRIFENRVNNACGQESATTIHHPSGNHTTPVQGHARASHAWASHAWASHAWASHAWASHTTQICTCSNHAWASHPPPKSAPAPTTPGPATPPKATPGTAIPPKATPGPTTSGPATPGPATSPKTMPGPAIPSATSTLPTTSSQLIAGKNLVPAEQWEKPEPRELAVPSQPEAEGHPSEASKPPTQGALSSPALPPKISPGGEEVPFLYKPHRSQNSPSPEVAMVMPTMARGEAAGSGEPVEDPQGLPAKPPASAQPADELLRHPVTGEVVERGSPMALLLAARQRAQKGRSGGAGLGRSSLPGSLHGHSSRPQEGSDSIFLKEGRPNSFTVVPKSPMEAEKDLQLTSSAQLTVLCPWKPEPSRNPEGTEPSKGHNWTTAEPQAPVAYERLASVSFPQDRLLPKSFSSPSSPSYKRPEEEEFSFEVIPPPPEFSNDPGPPALQYLGRRDSPVLNKFSNLGQSLDTGPAASEPRGLPRFPGGARYAGTRGLERFSGGGRSLIKKRLYVGEPHHSPGLSRGGTSRSLSSPNCFGPQPGGPFGAPGGPEMRRVNSAGRAPRRGLQTRRMSLEGPARGEAKYKAPGGDHGFAPATGR
ncbi:hypothetical protein PAL_GLEAN10025437 [Pteropus alecto]|uniref:Uncharacterized protein n=1 Tax=Pteropus alecto TaxID=9402 RepID=L5JN01_PTEAL|nr:hypothetical protein PAL_GLEAN10025437 [Pteropus alecto]